jgi:hypothetical protein
LRRPARIRGPTWGWKLARLNFPGAVYILDFYHAAEHLLLLANALLGEVSAQAKKLFRRWRKHCLTDQIDQVIAEAKAQLPKSASEKLRLRIFVAAFVATLGRKTANPTKATHAA